MNVIKAGGSEKGRGGEGADAQCYPKSEEQQSAGTCKSHLMGFI